MPSFLSFLLQTPKAFAANAATEKAMQTGSETLFGAQEFAMRIWDNVPYFIAAMVITALSYFIAKRAKKYAEDLLLRTSTNAQGSLGLVGKSAFIAVFGTGIVTALNIMNIDLTLIISAIGFGLGFAVKDILFNYLAGLFIVLTGPFEVGDFIEIDGQWGWVKMIESRNVVIRTMDGKKLIVTNADIFNGRLLNYSAYPERRIEVEVGVDFDTHLSQALEVLKAVVQHSKYVLKKPEPSVILNEFGDSSINFMVRFWVDSDSDSFEAKSKIIAAIKDAFDAQGIKVPYPIRTLTSKQGDAIDIHSMSTEEVIAKREYHKEENETSGDVFDSGNYSDLGRLKMKTDIMDKKAKKQKEKRITEEMAHRANIAFNEEDKQKTQQATANTISKEEVSKDEEQSKPEAKKEE